MKTAFVTGADRGLGNGLVECLLERGYRVIAGEYNSEWSQLGRLACDNLSVISLDISNQTSVDAASDYVKDNCDGIDLLINNAGIINKSYVDKITDRVNSEDIQRVFNVNSVGPLRVCNALIPHMVGMKRICIVSSEAGSINRSYRESWYGYCMSKAALNMAATIMFNELRPKGYTFRLIHPGHVSTYMSGEKHNLGRHEPIEAARIALQTFLDRDIDEDKLVMWDDDFNEYPF